MTLAQIKKNIKHGDYSILQKLLKLSTESAARQKFLRGDKDAVEGMIKIQENRSIFCDLHADEDCSCHDDLKEAINQKADKNHSHDWNEITGKPNEFPPTHHSHNVRDIEGLDDVLHTIDDIRNLSNQKLDKDGSNATGSLASTINNNHNHVNKAVLDTITASKVNDWDNAAGKAHNAVTLGSNAAGLTITNQVLQFSSGYQLPTTIKISEWDDAYLKRHTHGNKAVLDNLTQSVIDQSHAHSNKSVIDGITSQMINNWNASFVNNHTHSNKVILDGISSADVTNWDTAHANNHTHTNKVILDAITAAYTVAEKNKLATIQPSAQVNVKADWNATLGDAEILNKPSSFTPSSHNHAISDVAGLQSELDSKLETPHLNGFVHDVAYNNSLHTLTFYQRNEPNIVIDLPIEHLIKGVQLHGNDFVFTFEDGSNVTIPMNTLLVGVVKSVNGLTVNSQGEVVLDINDIPGLQSALNGRANVDGSNLTNIANWQSALGVNTALNLNLQQVATNGNTTNKSLIIGESISTIGGDGSGIYLAPNQGGGASITYNANGDLDISPRIGYDIDFTRGTLKTASHGTSADWNKAYNAITGSRIYKIQSPDYTGTGIIRLKISNFGFTGGVKIMLIGSYWNANVNGYIEVTGGVGTNGNGIWNQQVRCITSIGETRVGYYIEPIIKQDLTNNYFYIEIHKKNPALNPTFIHVELMNTSGDVNVFDPPSFISFTPSSVLSETNEVTIWGLAGSGGDKLVTVDDNGKLKRSNNSLGNYALIDGSNTVGGVWNIKAVVSSDLTSAVGNGQVFNASGSTIYWGNPSVPYHTFEATNANALRVYAQNSSSYGVIWNGLNMQHYNNWGLGTTTPPQANIDTNFETGFYNIFPSTVGTLPFPYASLLNISYANTEFAQIAIQAGAEQIKYRIKDGPGVVRNWVTLWDSLNLSDPATQTWVNSNFASNAGLNNKANIDGSNTTGGINWDIQRILSSDLSGISGNGQVFYQSGNQIYWGNPLLTMHNFEMSNNNGLTVYSSQSGSTGQIWHQFNFDPSLKANYDASNLTNIANWRSVLGVPTNNSQLSNGAGYITSSALNGYASQTWVNSQGYITSASLPNVSNATITYQGTGAITGGGSHTINQSGNSAYNFDLTNQTKNEISLGVNAYNSLSSKQDTLVAGSGISIIGNTVSATGSGGGIVNIATDSSVMPGPTASQVPMYFNSHVAYGLPETDIANEFPGNLDVVVETGDTMRFYGSYDNVYTVTERTGEMVDLDIKGIRTHIYNVVFQSSGGTGGTVRFDRGIYTGDQINITVPKGQQITIQSSVSIVSPYGNGGGFECQTHANLIWDPKVDAWILVSYD